MLYKINIIIFLLFPILSYSQKDDSLLLHIQKIDTISKNDFYNITVFNNSTHPICILYSASLFPLNIETANLVPLKKNSEANLFSLTYCAHDTIYDDMAENWNLNAYIILPLQELKFIISIPNSAKNGDFKVDYIILGDLRYNEFHNSIFSNAALWYKQYSRLEKHLPIK